MSQPAVHVGYDVQDDVQFGRMLKWSFGLHVGLVVLAFVVPREWLSTDRTPPTFMTINFGGPQGPETTGTASIGGRPVNEVTPPPKRPEPVRPVTAKPEVAIPPTKPVTIKPPPEPPKTAQPASRTTPPATGRQISEGNARAETGAAGQGAGLTTSGQGGLESDLDATFCCPEWAAMMKTLITREWASTMPGRGTTIVEFVVQRDGTITNARVVQSSGTSALDLEARRALAVVKQLEPLPDAYTERTLTVRLRFPYGGD